MNFLKNLAPIFLLMSTLAQGAITAPDRSELGLYKNYITNGGVERNLQGFSRYADAAGVAPVDATGGSPSNVTISRTTSSPLADTSSLLITKAASNSQGEGVAYAFSIPNSDQAKIVNVRFDYEVTSGTFVAGDSSDIRIYIVDVTNSIVNQCTPYTLQGGSGSKQSFSCSFQTASNSTSYRLVWHVATTSASAFTFKVDNIRVSREPIVYGAPVSAWQSYTMSITGTTSNPTKATTTLWDSAQWRQVGDTIQIRYDYAHNNNTGAANGSGTYLFSLPPGLSADANKVVISSTNAPGNVGPASVSTTPVLTGFVKVYDATHLSIYLDDPTANLQGMYGSSFGNLAGSDVRISFLATIPIQGLSAVTQMSSQNSEGRTIAANASNPTSSLTSTFSDIIFGTVTKDDVGAYSAGVYTVKVPGWYEAYATTLQAGTFAANAPGEIQILKNGAPVKQNAVRAGSSSVTQLSVPLVWLDYYNAGDTIKFQAQATGSSLSYAGGSSYNYAYFKRLGGNVSIAATETIKARYTSTSGQSISNGVTVIVDFPTKSSDSHGSVTTGASWKFSPSSPGTFSVKAAIIYASGSFAAGSAPSLYLYKNGSFYSTLQMKQVDATFTGRQGLSGSDEIELQVGDYIDVRTSHSESSARSLTTTAGDNRISIIRVGN
jgi:hypothetical protein